MDTLGHNYSVGLRVAVCAASLGAIFTVVLAMPVYAIDDNTVELAVSSDANLKSTGSNMYKATTSVKVSTAKAYGFNLTLRGDNSDLINSKDANHKIESGQRQGVYMGLNSGMWGYRLDDSENVIVKEQPDWFLRMPSGDDSSDVLIDTSVEGERAGCKRKDSCEVHVTFGANIDPTKLAAGSYSNTIIYTATAKPAPGPIVSPSICRSGDFRSNCLVELPQGLLPVKYTGTSDHPQWTVVEDTENQLDKGEWYDYDQKRWANAVSVKDYNKYNNYGLLKGRVVDEDDILSHWVYIPRYAYEVMRRDVINSPVDAQDFNIHFEAPDSPKRKPAACDDSVDYRTECGLDRNYIDGSPSNNGTWATHPAFTLGKRELNGIWVAKFEASWTNDGVTFLPNQEHLSKGHGYDDIGKVYTLAKSLSRDTDENNVGGAKISDSGDIKYTTVGYPSHLINNREWGAVAYLSSSKYGAGVLNIRPNSQSGGITGCGPWSDSSSREYNNGGTIGTHTACSNNIARSYQGKIGVLASTTGNVYGIYDMSGGAQEYIAAQQNPGLYNYSDEKIATSGKTSQVHFESAAVAPYVQVYPRMRYSRCSWTLCGGQALHEVYRFRQRNGRSDDEEGAWGGQSTIFGNAPSYPWAIRGGRSSSGKYAGLFNLDGYDANGIVTEKEGFRVVLTQRSK